MISKLTVCLSKFFVIFFKLIKRSDVIKVIQQIIVNVTYQHVENVKNDCNDQTNEKICWSINNACPQNENDNCNDKQKSCQNDS